MQTNIRGSSNTLKGQIPDRREPTSFFLLCVPCRMVRQTFERKAISFSTEHALRCELMSMGFALDADLLTYLLKT